MNTREAMQALLEGKQLINQDDKVLSFNRAGHLVWEDGHPAALANHDWQIYEEPNPHAKGTFAWAREESRRGRHVRRSNWDHRVAIAVFHSGAKYTVRDFDATDWEVV